MPNDVFFHSASLFILFWGQGEKVSEGQWEQVGGGYFILGFGPRGTRGKGQGQMAARAKEAKKIKGAWKGRQGTRELWARELSD